MRGVAGLVLLGGVLVACTGDDAPAEMAEAALDSAEAVEAQGMLMMAIGDASPFVSGSDGEIATAIASNVATRWLPSGCATVSQDGARLAITFDDCAGPHGLVHVAGTVHLYLVTIDSAVMVDATWTTIRVNGVTLSGGANGSFGIYPGGTGFEGSAYRITWDASSECASMLGDWDNAERIDPYVRRDFTSASVMRCAGGCPTGSVSRTFASGTSVTVTLDGSPLAHWQSSAGDSGTVALACP